MGWRQGEVPWDHQLRTQGHTWRVECVREGITRLKFSIILTKLEITPSILSVSLPQNTSLDIFPFEAHKNSGKGM